jgi:hypothetical protein
MTRLPRTIRLDASDTVIFDQAAEPGEWAVPGGFAFWDEETAHMSGKRRQAFRGGFLGLGSFGWATLVEVAEASADERATALAALAAHIHLVHGAPDEAAARAAAEEELAFAEQLCDHPPGTVLALTRSIEGGEQRERFRTLHLRAEQHRSFESLPVFASVETHGEDDDEPILRPDLTKIGKREA